MDGTKKLPKWVPMVGPGCHPSCGRWVADCSWVGSRDRLHYFGCPVLRAAELEHLCTDINPNAARNLEANPW